LASELCQTVGDELFFTLYIFLEVGKTQDLQSKIWQTLGDALRSEKGFVTSFLKILKFATGKHPMFPGRCLFR
jgi:hypothetical protein